MRVLAYVPTVTALALAGFCSAAMTSSAIRQEIDGRRSLLATAVVYEVDSTAADWLTGYPTVEVAYPLTDRFDLSAGITSDWRRYHDHVIGDSVSNGTLGFDWHLGRGFHLAPTYEFSTGNRQDELGLADPVPALYLPLAYETEVPGWNLAAEAAIEFRRESTPAFNLDFAAMKGLGGDWEAGFGLTGYGGTHEQTYWVGQVGLAKRFDERTSCELWVGKWLGAHETDRPYTFRLGFRLEL